MAKIYNPRYETMERKELEALQLKRLQDMVDYCIKRVPFYQERLTAAGIVSGKQIETLADIAKIPFTTKEDIRNNYPDGFLAVPKREVVRIHASSGTTGKPTVMCYTQKDMDVWADAAARVLCLNGVDEEDILQISVGYGLFTGALGFHYGAEKIGCAVVPASTGNTQKQLVMLRDIGATALMATPSYATYLSDLIRQSDTDADGLKLTRVLLGAERCTKSMRKTIEENLGVKTADNYGLTECFGPGVAGECECQCGMHITEDCFYPEIIDPETGALLPDGQQGELVFTSLLSEGMPLLRYRTRDITVLNHEKCRCGRTSVRMEAPFARTDDMFVFKGVNVFPTQIECAIDKVEHLSAHYHIKLERNSKHQDFATVFVEMKKPMQLYSEEEIHRIKSELDRRLKEIVIVRINTKLVDPETLQRYEGKAKRVEDLRYIEK
jgi:phenylacetate-CoA ligase